MDYLYLDTWQPSQNTYQGTGALQPTRLYNPDYRWEKTTKFEAGLDFSFFGDRINATLSFYRNRSSNQLVSYRLPATTGFTTVIRNFPALVQNSGTEISVFSVIYRKGSFGWSASANLTIPRTKLLKFPGLATSAYASSYVVGQPLNLIYRYRYTGVNAGTGLYTVEDLNKDNTFDGSDRQVLGNLDPKYYGGIDNNFQYSRFSLDFFFQFTKQLGTDYLGFAGGPPGTIRNMPQDLLNRWVKSGDESYYQRFSESTSANSAAFTAFNNYLQSDGIYVDASFIRLKNVSLRYTISPVLARKMGVTKFEVSLTGQNLFTLTKLEADPETQDYRRLPPLRTIACGIVLTL
jgi:TonB-dependent starch-binding outer membrane protein SusC